ncbi:diiron oxygenase [Acinetobacter pittii]|uniref:diiron oxygenase n=1 Tax=Acinetobacter pittii TaxID=48296 RepID=UPI00301E6131
MNIKINTNSRSRVMAESWSKRAAVRDKRFEEYRANLFDQSFREFPETLIPFHQHPLYLELDIEKKNFIDSLAWIYWNKRVVETEELIVAPAIQKLIELDHIFNIKGTDRSIIRQTLIDETFHSYMHEIAIENTIKWRNLQENIVDELNNKALIYRRYKEICSKNLSEIEKDLALVAWCFVGELSIYEFLNLVSKDETIQPFNRHLVSLHEKDENAHAGVFEIIILNNLENLKNEHKAILKKFINIAMDVFVEDDWIVWSQILDVVGVKSSQTIINDIKNENEYVSKINLSRSYERIYSVFNELNLEL